MRRHRVSALLWLTALSAGPIMSDAATQQYLFDGHMCIGAGSLSLDQTTGPYLTEPAAGSVSAMCSIPVGGALLGSGLEIDHVNFRGHLDSTANVTTSIWLHDYDSADYCECESIARTTSAHFTDGLDIGGADGDCDDVGVCSGGTPPTNWMPVVVISIGNNGSAGAKVRLKAFSVYDTI